jgi:hypothetical protein
VWYVPRCPPHLAHTISIRVMPCEVSSFRTTAPGRASKNAGHPHPELNLVSELHGNEDEGVSGLADEQTREGQHLRGRAPPKKAQL